MQDMLGLCEKPLMSGIQDYGRHAIYTRGNQRYTGGRAGHMKHNQISLVS